MNQTDPLTAASGGSTAFSLTLGMGIPIFMLLLFYLFFLMENISEK